MNYRHAFHAGNHADVLKHWTLVQCVERLLVKPAAFAALDTHAGTGLYDLTAAAAQRSPEWRDGVARLLAGPALPEALRSYIDLVQTFGPHRYPGSPALIARMLRASDRLIACELHPEDADALRRNLAEVTNAQIHNRDGFRAIDAMTPFSERRGLILIDPPYEQGASDLAESARAIRVVARRFRQCVVLWWRPLTLAGALDRAEVEALRDAPQEALRLDLDVDAEKGLSGSSVLVINPPFGLEARFAEISACLVDRLRRGPAASARAVRLRQRI